jgi:hypothetical protein
VDDVPDQRARVQLRLVGADQQHRMPRVVGVREARDLALGVGDHDLRDDPLVQRAHLRDVVDRERDGSLGDGRAVAHEPHADVQVLREERRERVLAWEVTQRQQVRAVLVECRLAELPVGVIDRGRGRLPGVGEPHLQGAARGARDRQQQVAVAFAEGHGVAGAHPRVARLVGRAPPRGERDDRDRRHVATLHHRSVQ